VLDPSLGAALAEAESACHGVTMTDKDEPNRLKGPTPAASADGDWPALRGGEIAVELPGDTDASVYFIGRVRTPWHSREQCPKNARESVAVCRVELDPRWATGLQGLETVSHVMLLYWMDRARRDLVLQAPRHYSEPRGTFALRSPARPNPIAVSVAQLLRVEGNTLYVTGVDCLDNTPLIDVKPYFSSTDSVPDAVVGWHASRGR
jgi:tRNA-Thr(GGU) m(6)t(6)A37 methyltransferase TsaA